jgi:hypothetical protein
LVVRLAEQLADARARLLSLEGTVRERGMGDEAFKAQTQAHLDRQDDMLSALARKLDDVLAADAEEARQRALLLQKQEDQRKAAAVGHRETLSNISGTAVSMFLMVAAGLLGELAATWTPRLRAEIFIGALVVAGAILLVQYVRSRPGHGTP